MPAPYIVGTPTSVYRGNGIGDNTLTFTKPSGLEDGDVLVAWLRCQDSAWAADWTLPSGWSRVGPTFVGSSVASRVNGFYMHVVTDADSESSTYIFTGYNTNSRRLGILMTVRGALVSPAPAGSVTDYAGTAITNGRRTETYTPTDTNGEDFLVLFGASSEFASPTNHVPTATPSGFIEALGAVGPSTSTSLSRTYSWTGYKTQAPVATGTASITWSTSASPAAESIAFQGLPDSVGDGLDAYNGNEDGVKVFAVTADGIRTPQQLIYLDRGYPSVNAMLAEDEFYWAHRGGSASFPEHSLWAYTQSALRGFGALEVSLGRTSDGVWFGLHDETLDRTSGLSGAGLTAASMTWSAVQAYQITIGAAGAPQPYATLDSILDAYGDSHVFILDPKYAYINGHLTEFMAICQSIGQDRCIVKYTYNSAIMANTAAAQGFHRFGYLYQTNISDTNFAANCALWDILGMDYTANQTAWDAVLAFGKPVVGHTCPDEAGITTARGKGATGFLCSGTAIITP